ncbi:uncharacterized protein LOC129971393 isoform X4 [Argiope bruennichi]|uniref:Uncharacterized protein n=1 Tax=Argiope bruennichi TaxID=94029 RepID=A0A8T0F9B6_ARGBR|nr:uncharacterized protein LOC129971393 isoform X4 [Argiope bruennichi]KAF8786795.1 hypothetical protein HNY73_008467 [Argiope bruennichi]
MSKATSIDICELIQENDLLFARYVEKDLLIVIILSGIVLHTCVIQHATSYCSPHVASLPPMKWVIHTLQKKPGASRKNRRRCRECYRQMKEALGRGKAGITAKQVTTFCSECPGQPPLCLPCFNSLHQKLEL